MPGEFKMIDEYKLECSAAELLTHFRPPSFDCDTDVFADQKVPQIAHPAEMEAFGYGEPDYSAFYPCRNTNTFNDAQKRVERESHHTPGGMSVELANSQRILDDLDSYSDITDITEMGIKEEFDPDMTSSSCSGDAFNCSYQSHYDPFCAKITEPTDPFYYKEYYDSSGSDSESDQMVINAINHYYRDIITVPTLLGIPQDPIDWSKDDVHLWVYFMLCRERLPVREANNFVNITGQKLFAMSEQDIRLAAPKGCDEIVRQIDLWRSASTIYETRSPQQLDPSMTSSFPTSFLPPTPTSHPITPSTSPTMTSHQCHVGPECPVDPSEPPARKQTIHLWQFLKRLLICGLYPRAIRWIDESQGIFKIENSTTVAKLWGKRKNRPAMNYDKLSRSIRQYYKKGIIKKTLRSKRLVYQFCREYM